MTLVMSHRSCHYIEQPSCIALRVNRRDWNSYVPMVATASTLVTCQLVIILTHIWVCYSIHTKGASTTQAWLGLILFCRVTPLIVALDQLWPGFTIVEQFVTSHPEYSLSVHNHHSVRAVHRATLCGFDIGFLPEAKVGLILPNTWIHKKPQVRINATLVGESTTRRVPATKFHNFASNQIMNKIVKDVRLRYQLCLSLSITCVWLSGRPSILPSKC